MITLLYSGYFDLFSFGDGGGSFAINCPIEYMKFGIHKVEVMIVRVLSFQRENFFKLNLGQKMMQSSTLNVSTLNVLCEKQKRSNDTCSAKVLNYAALRPNFTH